MAVTVFDFCRAYGINIGDRISVHSGGQLMGVGSFIGLEGFMIIWSDLRGNLNFTDLRVSSIKKGPFCCDKDNVLVTDL